MWTASDYEPDKLIASTYFGGAMASWSGALYFGTMNFPGAGASAHRAHPDGLLDDGGRGSSVADRSVLVMRATLPPPGIAAESGRSGTAPTVELLYGEPSLAAWNGATWQTTPTRMGKPLLGRSGFGNSHNICARAPPVRALRLCTTP